MRKHQSHTTNCQDLPVHDSHLAMAKLKDDSTVLPLPNASSSGISQSMPPTEKRSRHTNKIRQPMKGGTLATYVPPPLRVSVKYRLEASHRLDRKDCRIQDLTSYSIPSKVECAESDIPYNQHPFTSENDGSSTLIENPTACSPMSTSKDSGSSASQARGLATSSHNPSFANSKSELTETDSPGRLDVKACVNLPSSLEKLNETNQGLYIKGTESVRAKLPPHLRILEGATQKRSETARNTTAYYSTVMLDDSESKTLLNDKAQRSDKSPPHLQNIPHSAHSALELGEIPTLSHAQNFIEHEKEPAPASELLDTSNPKAAEVEVDVPADNVEQSAQGQPPYTTTDPHDIAKLTQDKINTKEPSHGEITTEVRSVARMSRLSSDQSLCTATGVKLQSVAAPAELKVQNMTTTNEASLKSDKPDMLLDQAKGSNVLTQELAANEEPPANPTICGSRYLNPVERNNVSLCANSGEEMTDEKIRRNDSEEGVEQVGGRVELDAEGYVIKKTTLEYELAGWDGNWKPAPLEWDDRPSFDNNDKRHIDSMERWMNHRTIEALEHPLKLDVTLPLFVSGEGPASGTSTFLWPPYPVDWTTKMPDDPFSLTKERREQTSFSSSDKFRKERHERRVKREKARRNFLEANEEARRNYVEPPNVHIPKANIYIRPVQRSDVPQITELYNHYVKFSPVACEIEETTEDNWRGIVRGAHEERLPFLVAVRKSTKEANNYHVDGSGRGAVRPRNGRYQNRRFGPTQEFIVGFAFAEDHAGVMTAFKYTAEMQCFVHNQWLHQGVGKSLVDRIIAAMDPIYLSRHGTEFLVENKLDYENGGRREIHRIILNIGYYPKDDHALKWQKDWLAKEWNFEHVGTLPAVGYKNHRE